MDVSAHFSRSLSTLSQPLYLPLLLTASVPTLYRPPLPLIFATVTFLTLRRIGLYS